jgi:hypothetical protein
MQLQQSSREQTKWTEWLHARFFNCLPNATKEIPTYSSGQHRSVIDYFFADTHLQRRIQNGRNTFLPAAWTDHALLNIDLENPSAIYTGKGFWRMNPLLLESEEFCADLEMTLDQLEKRFSCDISNCTQDKWNTVKLVIRTLATQHSKSTASKARRQISNAQRHRQRILATHPMNSRMSDHTRSRLDRAEEENTNVMEERPNFCVFEVPQNGMKWENGMMVTSLKPSRKEPNSSLVHPTTNNIETSPEGLLSSATTFYKSLYTHRMP